MKWDDLKTLAEKVQKGELSAVELVKKSLDAIEKAQEYNAVLRTAPDAIKRAEDIDSRIAKGEDIGPLAGVPYLAKDNYLTKGVETTASSNILKGFIPPINSTVVQKLEDAGAIMVGKTNLDAFAHGSSTENSDFGPTLNPVDKTRVPGGSSGGSTAAVALGLAPFALGTDTGGSIRQPASFCGVVGYKPTYGLSSRYGTVAMASSTDVMGPITNSVEDSAYILEIISGKDGKDSTIINREDTYLNTQIDLKGLRVGVVEEYFGDGVDKDIEDRNRSIIKQLEDAGAEVSSVSIPILQQSLAIYYVLVPAEVSSNLSRYDGMRYGPRVEANNLSDTYKKTRSEGFNAENRRRIMIGTYVLSSGYYDAYYKKASQARTLLAEEYQRVFKEYDVLVGPTTPTTAFKLGQNTQDPLSMYMSDVMTVGPSIAGLPAISIPIGVDTDGLPIGMQLTTNLRQDKKLFAIAKQIEEIV